MYTLAVNTSQMLFPEHNASQQVLVLRDVSESEGMHRLLVEFLANIAHEFRTPLSALTASIELLSEQIEILTLEELRELITALHLGTLNLHTLINNLLESANIETGQFRVNPQPTNLSDIIKSALNTLQPLFEKYKQNINFLSPPAKEIPLVIADDRRSIQALLNLLANAIKWNPFGGTITVKVSTEYRSSDTDSKFVQVSVIDDGKGLTSNGEHLYQRFYRNEQGVYRTHAGAGLGLSVAKAIVTAQNGEIGATNNEQGGAKFWINFRVAEINSVDLPIFESDSHNN
jgi:signal transduction histidine kinase